MKKTDSKNINIYFSDSSRVAPQQPNPNESIFRVLSEWKLNKLLETKSLYFSRLDKFWSSDPNEGLWTVNEIDSWKRTNFNAQKFNQWNAQRFAVSCWASINNHNNKKLWRNYNPDNDGIGITSTPAKLNALISDSLKKVKKHKPSFFSAIVEYENLKVDNLLNRETKWLPNATLPIFRKNKKDFKYEKEIRFVIDAGNDGKQAWQIDENGLFLPFKNFDWIDSVIFDPRTPKKKCTELKNILSKFLIKKLSNHTN